MGIKSAAVFCGSQLGKDERFMTDALQIGRWLALHNIRLVYGGGNIGLMGIVANAVLENGGSVTGVIPEILDKRERAHKNLTELLVVENMHIRKKKMYELCDVAIILPGGYGTLDELFEMITWNNLSIHDKRIFIINTTGYYNHLLAHISTMQQQGFLYEAPWEKIIVIDQLNKLEDYLR